jgi:hypothetical protein
LPFTNLRQSVTNRDPGLANIRASLARTMILLGESKNAASYFHLQVGYASSGVAAIG